MRHESAFRVDAVSPAGALGIMQIMPDTAAYVAGRLKIGYDPSKLIGEPDFNITIGRAYLEHLLRIFDGSYVLAIAAYNAGPNRVLEWVERFGDPRQNGVDARAWVDNIPFRETRLYVRRVLRSLDLYRQRFAAVSMADQCMAADSARGIVYAAQ
jgi:soluble lytic murein transglycosylase